MRRVGSWGVAAALIVGLGLTVAGAEEPQGDSTSPSAKSSWWSGWFGDKPPTKPKAKAKAEKNAPVEDKPAPSNSAESAAVEQKRQMNAYLRRVEVCLRLRQIAEQTGNADLQRQAEEMDARAWEIYRRQTAQVPVSGSSPDAEIKPAIKKSAKKPMTAGSGSNERDYDNPVPAVAQPSRSPQPLGGDFEQRERDLLNGTFMGRDKP